MSPFPLSPFRKVGDLLYISGQIGQENGQLVSDTIEAQTQRAIANITAILAQNGLTLSNVIDVTAFLINEADYEAFNEAYRSGFPEPFPARTTVTVKALPLGAKVELKAIAAP
jgi:2-iminobutanoate/2-iminopropanoate deaminase